MVKNFRRRKSFEQEYKQSFFFIIKRDRVMENRVRGEETCNVRGQITVMIRAANEDCLLDVHGIQQLQKKKK